MKIIETCIDKLMVRYSAIAFMFYILKHRRRVINLRDMFGVDEAVDMMLNEWLKYTKIEWIRKELE